VTLIYLIRHGKTSFTGNRISGYLPGIHLTDEGKVQAARTASFLVNTPITAIYASPLERTMETATLIAERFNLEIREVDFLKEINFGKLQGMGSELKNEPSWQVFLNTPSQAEFPQGETVIAAQKRVVDGLNRLSQIHGAAEEIVCVSHCEAIRLAIAYALNTPLNSYMTITAETASISRIKWEIDHQQVIDINIIPSSL